MDQKKAKKALLSVPQGSANPVYRWMTRELIHGEYFLGGEVLLTPLAEAAAFEFGRHEWLDDESHWVWDAAYAASLSSRKP